MATETAPAILPFENALETALDFPAVDSIIEPQKTDASVINPGKTLDGKSLGIRLGYSPASAASAISQAKSKYKDGFSEWARSYAKASKKKDPDGYGWEPCDEGYKCVI